MHLDTIPNLICIFIIAIAYKKLQPQWLQLFLYFLIVSFIVDLGATYYSQSFKKSNHFIINFFLPVNFCFYFFIFYKTFETKKLRKIVLVSVVLYLGLFLVDILFINGIFFYNTYSYCGGSILVVFCCLLYFMWLFSSDKLLNYFKIPMFWIATGLLFFYAGNLVQYSLVRYIIEHDLVTIYYTITIILSCILFGAFSIGFLCNQSWKKNS